MTVSSGSSELRDLYRLGLRGALLLLPFLFLLLLELFVLPIDLFTFRIWEAALAAPYRYPGPFYPNLYIKKGMEYGDRYRLGDPSQIKAKPVEWFTDSYGYRNRPETEKQDRYNVVVLGDSNFVGGFLDQKDTLTEVLSARAKRVAYSYSYGSDHISLYFSDPRMARKHGDLLVVESKVGNWETTQDYLRNFNVGFDGLLYVVDRSKEFSSNFYKPARKPFLEAFDSRLTKQAMLNCFKANLAADFTVPIRNNSELFVGRSGLVPSDQTAWRPFNWVVSGGARPLPEELQPALAILPMGQNSYWHTERFVSTQADGKIIVRFEAKNSLTPSRHRVWIFEDGSYRPVGEFVATSSWLTFEIPITTNPGSILEFQIDQPDAWQSLSVRDVHVIGGRQPALATKAPMVIPMSAWTGTGEGAACKSNNGGVQNCWQWPITGKNGYVQTPVLPEPGEGGMLIRFEARTDKPATAFSSIYLFEGTNYRVVAQYAFGSEWREYKLFLQPNRSVPIKIQVDFPGSVDTLAIRNFCAEPVERLLTSWEDNTQQKTQQKTQASVAPSQGVKPDVFSVQINSAPLFDSQQGWGAGYAKAIGHGPGVVVGPGGDNPNVFAQQFPTKPHEQFKVLARASSVDPSKAMGRIQVNWTDPAGKFISVSSQVFEVTPEEQTFEYQAVAPAGAVNGTLYVAADGKDNVVRYTEMRLLGKAVKAKATPAPEARVVATSPPKTAGSASSAGIMISPNPFPKPPNLTPLDGSGRSLSVAESQYYFYHATKAMERKARERGMDFIMYVMPDYNISRLMPAIQQLRAEGIKVLAYEPQSNWTSGVDADWYWQKADSHWTEAAVRLTADEILNMWDTQAVSNRPFSKELMREYANCFPAILPSVSGEHIDLSPNPIAANSIPPEAR
jgi:hypothetical protein